MKTHHGRYFVVPYDVTTPEGTGVCFAWTYWGNDRVRWYWVRLEDGREKAFSRSQVKEAA